ncbi:MOSC domain-containing protein [Lysobacter sp. S4-A87]|uniref:MOSC domain-containing protein n=1 Tax=Lysobacter sp. S4-A87 TaxID=2925843 RepID=UPI001F5305A1|nr:MOSC domain-containing protein [Lysobacter sp. S4-A87]UNK48457.1 MOSC domain-containing protein [Lysobacter sp. S4-A87]
MRDPSRPISIDAVLLGRARPYTRPGSVSAIDKRPADGVVRIETLGLVGDEQGDLRVHGGPDKAVHHYPFDHYARWREDLGDLDLLKAAGAFGENLSSQGLTEDEVCLGDRFRIGTALLEVSQGRQPCWKLNDRFAVADLARRVQATGRTGWYYRVLEPGAVRAGDAMALEARPHPQWSLRRLGTLLFERQLDPAQLHPALDLPLVPSWRKLLETRLQRAEVEDWGKRIEGPGRH